MLEYYKRKILEEEADKVLKAALEQYLFENPLQTDVKSGDVLILDIYNKNPNLKRMQGVVSWHLGGSWFSGKREIYEQFGNKESLEPLRFTVDKLYIEYLLFEDRVDAFFDSLTDLQLADTDNIVQMFINYSKRRSGEKGPHPLAPWWVHFNFKSRGEKILHWGNELDFWLKMDSIDGRETYLQWQTEIELHNKVLRLKSELDETRSKITTSFMKI